MFWESGTNVRLPLSCHFIVPRFRISYLKLPPCHISADGTIIDSLWASEKRISTLEL